MGTRDDRPKTVTVTVTVPPKKWEPDSGIGHNRVTQPDGSTKDVEDGRMLQPQDQTQSPAVPAEVAVAAGSGSLAVEVESATDLDKWTQVVSGYDSDELSYKWLCDKGSFLRKNGDSWEDVGTEAEGTGAGGTLQWKAPIGEGVETTAKLTCTIDDKPKDVVAPDTGQRGDGVLKREVTIRIVPRIWEVGSPIGKKRLPDGSLADDGYMAAPQYQGPAGRNGHSRSPDPAQVKVKPGGSLPCNVYNATDLDVWKQNLPVATPTPDPSAPTPTPGASPTPTPSSTRSGEEKDDVVYTWTCSDGYFVEGGQQVKTIKGRQVRWNAPAATPTPTPVPGAAPNPGAAPTPTPTPAPLQTVTLTCTIDDKPLPVVTPDGGKRDDGSLTLTTTVVIDPNATDADHSDDPGDEPGHGGTVPVNLKVAGSRNGRDDVTSICAGGWNDDWNDYVYLQKETGQMVKRGAKPDPHIITYTVTVTNDAGEVQPETDVTFTWDMPGPAPQETRTVTTDSEGKASVDVISGDEVSEDYDEETGSLLFNNPVKITVSCLGKEATQDLDVLAPEVSWQYKNENGDYVDWDGSIWGLYSDERKDIPLRVALTFDGLPVVGHAMSWGISRIFDKAETEIFPDDSDYSTYGQMSGAISTTSENGNATATFTLGYNFGKVILRVDDGNVNTLDIVSSTSSSSSSTGSLTGMAVSPSATSSTVRKKKRKIKPTLAHSYWKWVMKDVHPAWYSTGAPSSSTPYSYPAPGGEEDNELLPETLSLVRSSLPVECLTGDRNPWGHQSDPYGDPAIPGNWWFSQVIGADPDSATTHYADIKIVRNNKIYLYGAAFDIVLKNTPVFKTYGNSPLPQFESYVRALRSAGFVSWHRWSGEYREGSEYTAGSPASVENEIHSIEPAMPWMKDYLAQQVTGFTVGYANSTKNSGYVIDFIITEQEIKSVEARAAKKAVLQSRYAGYTTGPFGP